MGKKKTELDLVNIQNKKDYVARCFGYGASICTLIIGGILLYGGYFSNIYHVFMFLGMCFASVIAIKNNCFMDELKWLLKIAIPNQR